MQASISSEQLEQLAQKRARQKMGWYFHLLVFICVNTGLALVSGFHGHDFMRAPAWGWTIGLLIHGLVAFVVKPGNNLHQRLLTRERRALGLRHHV